MAYKLPDLPYSTDALEPTIDAKTMEVHHGKHHKSYTDKLNDALKDHEFSSLPIEEVLRRIDEVPESKRQAVINNGGGYANHNLFWTVMSPDGGGKPSGDLAEAIDKEFGSLKEIKEKFSNAAATQFGSGWGWLCVDSSGNLRATATVSQDSPYMEGMTPILGGDGAQHACAMTYARQLTEW